MNTWIYHGTSVRANLSDEASTRSYSNEQRGGSFVALLAIPFSRALSGSLSL